MTKKMKANAGSEAVKFQITAKKKGGNTAEIRITGAIGWEADAEAFRNTVDTFLADGIEDVHLYINSPGGSVFDATEIANLVSKFKNVTGEGGALVASAATYIALHCKTFSMPANGQFMIHKPSVMTSGTVAEIEGQLQSLKNIETDYYELYKTVAKDSTELEKKWNSGDWWMTAQEAKDKGFITEVRKKVKIDRETASMFTACGKTVNINKFNNNTKKMEIELIVIALGLPKDATEEQISAKIAELRASAASAEELRAKIKTMEALQIIAVVDAAVEAKKITADKKAHFVKIGETCGVESLRETFSAMSAAIKPNDIIKVGAGGNGEAKWSEMTAEDRVELRDKSPNDYKRLFKAEYGVEPEM